jgi:hypothetical protein
MARTLLARRETATDNVPALFRLRPLASCDLNRTGSATPLLTPTGVRHSGRQVRDEEAGLTAGPLGSSRT